MVAHNPPPLTRAPPDRGACHRPSPAPRRLPPAAGARVTETPRSGARMAPITAACRSAQPPSAACPLLHGRRRSGCASAPIRRADLAHRTGRWSVGSETPHPGRRSGTERTWRGVPSTIAWLRTPMGNCRRHAAIVSSSRDGRAAGRAHHGSCPPKTPDVEAEATAARSGPRRQRDRPVWTGVETGNRRPLCHGD